MSSPDTTADTTDHTANRTKKATEGTTKDTQSWLAVWVLGLGTFLFVTTELLPVGLLPSISSGVGVSISAAGLLVSLYGGIAAATAVPLTSLLGRLDRRWLLAGLLGILVIGNLASAAAPNYLVLVLSRMLIAFAHGVFWATTPAVGARLVAPRHAGRAIAVVLGGISVASVLGVPLGTIGQATNWRMAFLLIAVLGAVALIAVLTLMPSMASQNTVKLSAIPALLRNRSLRLVILVAALTMMGHYLAYTYLTPYLEQVVGIAPSMVSVLLLIFGAAGIAGNFIAGSTVTRNLRWSLLGSIGLLAVSLLILSIIDGSSQAAAIVLLITWGLSYAALPVCLQTWVLRSAPHAAEAASSLYVAVFNAAIALGALTGSITVDSTGITSITWIAAALVSIGLIVVLTNRKTHQDHQPRNINQRPNYLSGPQDHHCNLIREVSTARSRIPLGTAGRRGVPGKWCAAT